MNRPARLLIAAFIDLPARIIDGTLNRLMPPTPAHVLKAESERLARRVVSLEDQRDFLVDVLDDADNADRAEAMRRHPAGKGIAATLHTAKVAASADIRAAMFGAEDLDEWRRELGVRG